MGDGLRPGWRRVKFGDVVRLNKESSKDPAADGLKRYVGLKHSGPGDLRIRFWGDITDGDHLHQALPAGASIVRQAASLNWHVLVHKNDPDHVRVTETFRDPLILA